MTSRRPHGVGGRQPPAAQLTEPGRQGREGAARAPTRRRGTPGRRPQPRDHVWGRGGPLAATAALTARCATRSCPERGHAGGKVTAGRASPPPHARARRRSARFRDVSSQPSTERPSACATLGGRRRTAEQRSVARLNGVPSVILEVRRQSGENTVAVIDAAKQSLARLASQMPGGVRLEIIRDQSRYIEAALHEINIHLILGGILASLVVFAFMRDWRATIIAAVAIPASVVSAFGMMWALGFTLNSVTMLASSSWSASSSTTPSWCLENIFRRLEEKRRTRSRRRAPPPADIGLAVMATTFTSSSLPARVVHVDVSGRFLYQFGVTAAVVGAREPARVVHADAHDERAHDPLGQAASGHGQATRRPPRGAGSTRGRPRLYVTLRLVHAYRFIGSGSHRRDRVHVADYGWVKQEYTPHRRRRERVRGDHQRPEGISMPAWTKRPGHRHRGVPRCPRATVLITAVAASSRASAGEMSAHPRPTRSARSASGASGAGSSTAIPWPRSAATMPSAT